MPVADHVVEIAVFNERIPRRDLARFSWTPASGMGQVQAPDTMADTLALRRASLIHGPAVPRRGGQGNVVPRNSRSGPADKGLALRALQRDGARHPAML